MKDFGIVALLSVVIAAAAPASDAPKPAAMATQRSTEAFAECFAESQDREAAAWAYVPRKNGGTFSNLGAASVARPYFLLISDRGARREIQLQNAAPRGPQERGIMQCI